MQINTKQLKLNALQIEEILDRLVPLVFKPEEQVVCRFILEETASRVTSAEFAVIVQKLLHPTGGN
jgi:hypothetical protein